MSRWSTFLSPPSGGQDAKVLVLSDQVLGNDENRSSQLAVGVPHQAAVGAIDLVALIPRRVQAGSLGNGSGLGVALDRSHLARELGRRDDVDSGNTQKQHVGRLDSAGRPARSRSLGSIRAWPADRHPARRRTGDGVMPIPLPGGALRAHATTFCRVGLWIAIWASRSCRVRPSMPASTICAAEPRFLATHMSNLGLEDIVAKHRENPGM